MNKEYLELGHALQTGVAQEIALDFPFLDDNIRKVIKDLRVGVNMAMVDQGCLVTFLANKEYFVLAEYHSALVDALRDEVARYELELSARMNINVKLY
jgi:hypothetical protein